MIFCGPLIGDVVHLAPTHTYHNTFCCFICGAVGLGKRPFLCGFCLIFGSPLSLRQLETNTRPLTTRISGIKWLRSKAPRRRRWIGISTPLFPQECPLLPDSSGPQTYPRGFMQSGIKTALASQPAQSLRQSHAAIAITHARVAALAARTTLISSGWIHGLLAPPFWACSSHLAPVSGLIQILRVDGLICPDHWGPITRLYSDGNTQPVHSTYPPPTKGPWYRSHRRTWLHRARQANAPAVASMWAADCGGVYGHRTSGPVLYSAHAREYHTCSPHYPFGSPTASAVHCVS